MCWVPVSCWAGNFPPETPSPAAGNHRHLPEPRVKNRQANAMAPYLPHYHVWRAEYRDERSHIAYHPQLKPIYESGLLAQSAAEILRRETGGHFHFAEVCHTAPRICQLKIDRLTYLSQHPIVYHETRQGVIYKKPDRRFQWVQLGHPCALPAEFCLVKTAYIPRTEGNHGFHKRPVKSVASVGRPRQSSGTRRESELARSVGSTAGGA